MVVLLEVEGFGGSKLILAPTSEGVNADMVKTEAREQVK